MGYILQNVTLHVLRCNLHVSLLGYIVAFDFVTNYISICLLGVQQTLTLGAKLVFLNGKLLFGGPWVPNVETYPLVGIRKRGGFDCPEHGLSVRSGIGHFR